MSSGIDHQGSSTIGHIQMDIEVLTHVAQHLHRLPGREKTGAVRVDGVANHL